MIVGIFIGILIGMVISWIVFKAVICQIKKDLDRKDKLPIDK